MMQYLQSFTELCYARLEGGDKERKDRFTELDLHKEIAEELADVANYAFLEYIKIMKIKEKTKKLD